MSCGVVRRRSLDPSLLWLWHRPVDTAPIRLLAWEPPYAARVALEKAKRQKKKKRKLLNFELHFSFTFFEIDLECYIHNLTHYFCLYIDLCK